MFGKNQFPWQPKKGVERRISVVEIDHKTGLVYYTVEKKFGRRQPLTPGGITMDTFNAFFGVNARDYAPA